MADLVNFVSNCCWPKNEAPVVGPVRLDSTLQVRRLVRDAFTLLSYYLFDSNHPATKFTLLRTNFKLLALRQHLWVESLLLVTQKMSQTK